MQFEDSEDKRIFARFPVKLSMRFLDLLADREVQGQALDISAKGVGFVSATELKPLTPLELWLKVPDKGDPLYTRGEVVWSEMVGPNQFRTGVNLESADLMGISRVLRTGQ
jgi:hypothetical protein